MFRQIDNSYLTFTRSYIINNLTSLSLSDNKTISVRVFIEWNDSETQEMNNADDTATTTPVDAAAKLDVGISFVQLPSE